MSVNHNIIIQFLWQFDHEYGYNSIFAYAFKYKSWKQPRVLMNISVDRDLESFVTTSDQAIFFF